MAANLPMGFPRLAGGETHSEISSAVVNRPSSSCGLKVSAVIPCLNEERTIGNCITKVFNALAEMGVAGEVIVADNGSTDLSVGIARNLGARVVHQPVRGYGAALRKGIEEARGEIIIMADADESYDWQAIAPFVRKIEEGFDLVMGNRFKGGIMPGAMPPLHRYLGNPVLSALARVAFGVKIGDFHCGMRAFRKAAVARMVLQTDGMEFATEMIANASCQGLRIAEIPTKLYPDKRQRPPHLRSFRDGWRHLRFILTYAPDYLYLAPGLGLLAAGLTLLGLLAGGPVQIAGHYVGIHFLALGSLLSLAGFNIFNLGVFAKALMAQRYTGLKSRTVNFFRGRFSLEIGLILGVLMIAGGIGVDVTILAQWLGSSGNAMDATVHAAFVATTVVVLGMNVLFSSFLISMILSRDAGLASP
jgi:glycosyltransferase involved in cell wall biosynthesis